MRAPWMRLAPVIFLQCTLLLLLISSACSPRTFSIVPDKSQYKLLEEDGKRALVSTLLSRKVGKPKGSTIHTLLARSTLRSTNFEQAFLFSEDSSRLSLYTPNFSKLLYFVVATPEGTLSCDVSNKEAIVSEDSGKVYLPELPPMLLNPKNFRHFLLGEVPLSLFQDEVLSLLDIRTFIDNQGNEKSIVKGRINHGRFEGLLVRVENTLEGDSEGGNWYRLEKVILRPDNSKEAVQVEYFYSEMKSIPIPKEIKLYTLERSLDVIFSLKKMSHEISGTKESLFSLQPPRGYEIYATQ